jgi:hypothetical protein
LIETSPLRTAKVLLPARPFKSDTEIEITTFVKTKLPDHVPMDKFRRSSYSVISLPKGEELPEGYKTDKVVRETISAVVDPKTFWGKLRTAPALPARPSPAIPDRSQKRALPVDGAAAEKFPVTITRRGASSRYIATFQRGQNYPDTLQASLC